MLDLQVNFIIYIIDNQIFILLLLGLILRFYVLLLGSVNPLILFKIAYTYRMDYFQVILLQTAFKN